MDFDLSEDQRALLAGVQQILDKYRTLPVGSAAVWLRNEQLERDLADTGYFAVGSMEGMGPLEAALVVEAVARLPQAVETTGTLLLAPRFSPEAARPVAVCAADEYGAVRFLQAGGTLLVYDGRDVRWLQVRPEHVGGNCDSPLAFPYARPQQDALGAGRVLPDADPQEFLSLWRLGVAAELCGAMQSALETTLTYVKERRQFGRPLGAFQAVQHRLAECAMLVESARILMLKAAHSAGEGSDSDEASTDSALALCHAQEAAMRIAYDTHQFHGAMGLTLEYPLHYWTQRLRGLQGECGGGTEAAQDAAPRIWGDSGYTGPQRPGGIA